MSEKLEVYDLDENLIEIKDREEFYREIKEEFEQKGKISKQVKRVLLLLMNSSGRIYLQKRSKLKYENPGLYDKTIGGHVSQGSGFDVTIIRECAEELGFPTAVLSTDEFEKSIKGIRIETIGILRKIECISDFVSERVAENGKIFIQPFITSVYVGYYNGSIKFVDGESSGIEVFSLNELKDELKENPGKFTKDVGFMIKKYEKFLIPIK